MRLILLFVVFISTARAERPAQESVWDYKAEQWLSLAELSAKLEGKIVVLGEEHAVENTLAERVHQGNQKRLLDAIQGPLSVGMEFFPYTAQASVDAFLSGGLSESDFLKEIGWGGNAFELYKPQVLAPRERDGVTLALNMPRAITRKISQQGRDRLSEDERALLPPVWERGRPEYFERFVAAMGGHGTEQQLQNYFWSQSLWDDTMAWRTSLRRSAALNETFVIIVGAFHAEYGHGLPARLIRHGVDAPVTVLQKSVNEWSEENLAAAVSPHAAYGSSADYVWVYKLP